MNPAVKLGAHRRQWLKRLIFRWRFAMVMTIPFLLAVAVYRIAQRLGYSGLPRLRLAIPRALGWLQLWAFGISLTVEGQENVDAEAAIPRLFFCNHNSRFDGYAMFAASPVPFKLFWSTTAHMLREKYRLVMLFARVFDVAFLHDKTDNRRTVAEFARARDFVAQGGTLSLFPEGQFSKNGLVEGFGIACASLAIRTQAVIHPVLIVGTEDYYEQGNRGQKQGVKVIFLPAVDTKGLTLDDKQPLSENIVNIINGARMRELALRGEGSPAEAETGLSRTLADCGKRPAPSLPFRVSALLRHIQSALRPRTQRGG